MNDQRCLYVMLRAPADRLEDLLMGHVAEVVAEVRDRPELDSLFFVRFSEPFWQLRFRLLGRPEWIETAVRPMMRTRCEALKRSAAIEGFDFATYDREYERYGGPEGMILAEQLFFLDSLAALDLIALDRAGGLAKSRREFSILLVDRLLDLARFTRRQRLAFYRHGYAWATEMAEWGPEEMAKLEQRFQALRSGLDRIFRADLPAAERWGGADAARLAERFLSQAKPVVDRILEGHAAGRIRQDVVYLFWSYAHMFTNRLGIEAAGEAVLRFFIHRWCEEHKEVGV